MQNTWMKTCPTGFYGYCLLVITVTFQPSHKVRGDLTLKSMSSCSTFDLSTDQQNLNYIYRYCKYGKESPREIMEEITS